MFSRRFCSCFHCIPVEKAIRRLNFLWYLILVHGKIFLRIFINFFNNSYFIYMHNFRSYLFLNILPFEFLIPTLYANNKELHLYLNIFFWVWYCSSIWNSPILKFLYHKIYHLNPCDCIGGELSLRCILLGDSRNYRHYRNLEKAFLELKLHYRYVLEWTYFLHMTLIFTNFSAKISWVEKDMATMTIPLLRLFKQLNVRLSLHVVPLFSHVYVLQAYLHWSGNWKGCEKIRTNFRMTNFLTVLIQTNAHNLT